MSEYDIIQAIHSLGDKIAALETKVATHDVNLSGKWDQVMHYLKKNGGMKTQEKAMDNVIKYGYRLIVIAMLLVAAIALGNKFVAELAAALVTRAVGLP